MSMPTIPDMAPHIDLSREDIITLLLASVALEEISLSHILNAEGEKLQAVLDSERYKCVDISTIKDINESVERTVNGIARMQMMLQMKMENILRLTTTTTTSTTTCTRSTTTCSTTHSSTTASTCAPITPKPHSQGIDLIGYGEGTIPDKRNGAKGGIARLSADIGTARQDSSENFLEYTVSEPENGKPQDVELRAVPSSLKIERHQERPDEDGTVVLIVQGTGLLRDDGPESDEQTARDFYLQLEEEKKKLSFRMRFRLPDGADYHDSGIVNITDGNLKLLPGSGLS